MKKVMLLALMVVLFLQVNAQSVNSAYDSTLAKKLGADDYGMKSYVFVILKSGTSTTVNPELRDSIFRGHLNNISRLAGMGKLVIAGPLGDNDKSYRGIFIFNVSTIAEAKELLMTDPAVKAKLLDAELYEWYGSAAISEYLKVHDKIAKKKF
jgi:uncharacterized protein YciI